MIRCDAVIAGGGPAGSTCARVLRKAGWEVIVVDRARFPRDKVCAGWLTPEVFPLLELDPGDYKAAGLTLQEITGFRTGVLGGPLLETRYPRVVSYAIRRCEFDSFLLKRARVRVLDGTPVATMRRNGSTWIVNEQIEAPLLVGAGGHFCPVARHLRGHASDSPPVVAKEAEFRLTGPALRRVPDTPSLLFCRDLEGYGWFVRKGEYLNVGIGRRDSRDFAWHVRDFVSRVENALAAPLGSDVRWRGHAYLASGAGARALGGEGVVLVGDAAGLAYPESGEGIRPAIESGRLAAEAVTQGSGRCDPDALQTYAAAMQRLHPPVSRTPDALRRVSAALGRLLLGNRAFTRHFVLDRWFLRQA